MKMDKLKNFTALKTILAPYVQDPGALAQLQEDTDFIRDLQINSANLVDLVLDVEEHFGIEIDNDSMARMLTVQASLEVIDAKLAEKNGTGTGKTDAGK